MNFWISNQASHQAHIASDERATMTHTLIRTRIIQNQSKQYTSKIVFDNLEHVLDELGYVVQKVEARESGKATPIATRASINSHIDNEFEFELKVAVRLAPHENKHYNTKIVLADLEEAFNKQGIWIETCETRERGLETPIAIRAKLKKV